MLNSERVRKLRQLTKAVLKYEILSSYDNYDLDLSVQSSLSTKLLASYFSSVQKAVDTNKQTKCKLKKLSYVSKRAVKIKWFHLCSWCLNVLTHVYDTCWTQPSPIRIDSNCTQFFQLENVSHLAPLDETDLKTDDLASYYYSKKKPPNKTPNRSRKIRGDPFYFLLYCSTL